MALATLNLSVARPLRESEPFRGATRMESWLAQHLVVTVAGPAETREIRLDRPFARLGSLASADIPLKSEGAPKRGLYLHATREGVFCLPLSAPSEQPSLFHGWLAPEERVRIGKHGVGAILAGALPIAPPVKALDEKTDDPGLPRVELSHQGRVLANKRLRRRLTIVGRERPSTLRLHTPELSACHCALYWDDEGLWIIDLLSTNGTRIGGRRIDAELLPVGAVAQLGDIEIRLIPSAQDVGDGMPQDLGESEPAGEGSLRVGAIELAEPLQRTWTTADEAVGQRSHLEGVENEPPAVERDRARAEERRQWQQERRAFETEASRLQAELTASQERQQSLQEALQRRIDELEQAADSQGARRQQERIQWEADRKEWERRLAEHAAALEAARREQGQALSTLQGRIGELEQSLQQERAAVERQRLEAHEAARRSGQIESERVKAAELAKEQLEAQASSRLAELESAWADERQQLQMQLAASAEQLRSAERETERIEAEAASQIEHLEQALAAERQSAAEQLARGHQQAEVERHAKERLQGELETMQSHRRRAEEELAERTREFERLLAAERDAAVARAKQWSEQRGQFMEQAEQWSKRFEAAQAALAAAEDRLAAQRREAAEAAARAQSTLAQERASWRGQEQQLEQQLASQAEQIRAASLEQKQREIELAQQVSRLEESLGAERLKAAERLAAAESERTAWTLERRRLEARLAELAEQRGALPSADAPASDSLAPQGAHPDGSSRRPGAAEESEAAGGAVDGQARWPSAADTDEEIDADEEPCPPEGVEATPAQDETLDRMLRFSRRKRGWLLPLVKAACVAALWMIAIAAAAGMIYLAMSYQTASP